MRVSAKTDYALRALLEMSSRDDGKPVSAEELGRLQGIPHGFLQAILADLRKAGVVIAQRGQSGGCQASSSAVREVTASGRLAVARAARLTFSNTSRSELRAAIQTSWSTSAFSL